MRLNKTERKQCQKAARHIMNISWGNDGPYWGRVVLNLLKMADINRPCKIKPVNARKTKKRCRKAVSLIYESFVWIQTREGHDYWADVVNRLEDIADNA